MTHKTIVGLVEPITIKAGKAIHVLARIDSGATQCSIDKKLARDLKLGPILSIKTVKSVHGKTRRSVVMVKFVLGGKILENKFNIADRSHMKYKVLLGNNSLKGNNILINPDKTIPQ